jgi:type VI secretion system protein ImpL
MSLLPKSRGARLWLLTAVVYLVFAVLVWFLGDWLALRGANLWVLRGALWVLGLVAAGVVVWFVAGAAASGDSGGGPAGGDDLDTTLSAAAARLGSARAAGAPGLRGLPMIVVLGPEGSTKTTIIVNSGLAPDLLAGEVFKGDRIGPTPGVNLWYTQRSVVLEAGGKFAADAGSWRRLIRRIRPRTLRASLTGQPQAARAAVVCFSCEELLKPGSAQAVPAVARELRTRLTQLAQGFGVPLPVYVVFTKADRIPYFPEFVEHLSREEAEQVLGTTLPWPGRATAGIYADREFQRLNAAYDRLLAALAAKRLNLLARERDGERQAGVYEFPRELRKTVPAALQFLVDLCRPSQLELSPVLRGFYYTGVRAVLVSDAAPAPAPGPSADSAGRVAAATQVFDALARGAGGRAPAPAAPSSRRMPQWLFLSTLVRDVWLRDRAPVAVAQGARSVAALRRVGLAAAVLLSLVGGLWSTVQYSKNEAAVTAAKELATLGPSGQELATLETLARLETLRVHLGRLARWSRWWWYKGTALYGDLLQLYKARFDRILLEPTQLSLLAWLDSLPTEPKAPEQYGFAYERLKAYLMTTTDPDKLAADFVVPQLVERWVNGRQVETERTDLARRQFEFYATTLCRTAPCGTNPGARTVDRTRAFLGKFKGTQRFYELIISNASARNPAIAFQRLFPNAAVVDPVEVPGAFTAGGWAAVQDAKKHLDLRADDWVLGGQQVGDVDRATLVHEVDSLYVAEYVRRWRAFLDAAHVPPAGSAREEARKLAALTGNPSPLLQLLALVAQHAKVDSKRVQPTFQPVIVLVPGGATVSDATKPYLTALAGLRGIVDQMAGGSVVAGGLAPQAMELARGARPTVTQIAEKFSTAAEAAAVGPRVQSLLEEPIAGVEQLVGRLPLAALNGRAADFCASYGAVLAKYPFNPDAHTDASLGEVDGMLDPATGGLKALRDALQDVLEKRGGEYVAKPGGFRASGPFLRFLNRLSGASDALFPPGAKDPSFDFTVKLQASELLPTVTFSMDAQAHAFSRTSLAKEPYTWSGATAREVRILGTARGRDETLLLESGKWALFRLLQRATWVSEGPTIVRWPVTPGGQAVALEAEFDLGVARPVLKRDYFAGLSCVSSVVQ